LASAHLRSQTRGLSPRSHRKGNQGRAVPWVAGIRRQLGFKVLPYRAYPRCHLSAWNRSTQECYSCAEAAGRRVLCRRSQSG
jgi:hypothetical protein